MVDKSFPQVFGRYLLKKRISLGGMAEVFLAHQKGPHGFERRVALKRILPHLAKDDEFVQSFIDEAKLGALLIHPNLVQTLDFDFVDNQPYIAMEFIEGGHLGNCLNTAKNEKKAIPINYIYEIFMRIAEGLNFLHSAKDTNGFPLNAIHRDIKPSNILIGYDGQIKISDFGISKASITLVQTLPDVIKGSLPYMSPEQAKGVRNLTVASDMFSLGAILFELLVGSRLHLNANQLGMLSYVAKGVDPERFKLIESLKPEYAPFADVLKHLLEYDPQKRSSSLSFAIDVLNKSYFQRVSNSNLSEFATTWLNNDTTSKNEIVIGNVEGIIIEGSTLTTESISNNKIKSEKPVISYDTATVLGKISENNFDDNPDSTQVKSVDNTTDSLSIELSDNNAQSSFIELASDVYNNSKRVAEDKENLPPMNYIEKQIENKGCENKECIKTSTNLLPYLILGSITVFVLIILFINNL